MGRQFRFAGPTLEVELDHLQGADAWFASRPEGDEQAGYHGQVDLNRDALLAERQQMTATQDALEPAKKQLHGPAKTVPQSDQFRREVETAGRQEQDVGTALCVRLAGIDFEDADGLLEDRAALGAAQPNEAIAADAGGLSRSRERTFLDDGCFSG